MSDDTPGLPEFFEALKNALEEADQEVAVVTIIMPGGQLCDFEISYLGEHNPNADEDGEAIWKDDTQN